MNKPLKRGYLLLEAVVSIAVVAIGLAVILRSFASSLRASKISQEYFIASSLLNDTMSSLEEKVKLNVRVNKPWLDGSEAINGEEVESAGIKYHLDVEIKPLEGLDNLSTVSALISWDNGKRKERMRADTFLPYKNAP